MAAFEQLGRSTGNVEFSTSDIITEMRRAGSTYPDSTIRTHLSAHMINDGSLVRSERGSYRLARHRGSDQGLGPDAMQGVSASVRSRRPAAPNGAIQLADVLRAAGYATTLDAVAAHTIMLHPRVVDQTNGQAVFRTVRRDPRQNEQVGSFGTLNNAEVMFDDNQSPISAFIWAAGLGRGVDMQFNHIWPSSRDVDSYTALWNICATPAFLAKTTDGSSHPEVVAALRRRASDLNRCTPPAGQQVPEAPDGYETLNWAPPPAPVESLEGAYRRAMSTKPKDRVVISARRIGWLFSSYAPDETV